MKNKENHSLPGMKLRGARARRILGYRLPLPIVFGLCAVALFIGFLLPSSPNLQFPPPDDNPAFDIQRQRFLESDGDPVTLSDHGQTGDDHLSFIPYQFASKEQCEKIIALAKTRLSPSSLALRKGETATATQNIRTSQGCFLSSRQDKSGTLAWVEQKMAKATMIPKSHGEAFNVLRYEIGQKYNSHYDVFNPDEYGPQKSQRLASFLLYLSDVEEGGETMFPFEDGNINSNYNYKDCIGLKVKPRQGDALLFYSIYPNGTFDKTALHGSCPVIKGEKWVATKWIRDKQDW